MVPRAGIEPATQSSSGFCSTTELPRHYFQGEIENILEKYGLTPAFCQIQYADPRISCGFYTLMRFDIPFLICYAQANIHSKRHFMEPLTHKINTIKTEFIHALEKVSNQAQLEE